MAQRRDSEQRKREIAAAALRLAGTKGFHKLTTSMLAKEVGLSDGAIFRHFANKKEIIDATILRFEELLMEDFPPTDAHPLQRLRALFFQRVRVLCAYPELRAIAFNSQLSLIASEEGAKHVQSIVQQTKLFIRQCLLDAQQERMIGDDIPVEIFLSAFIGVIRGAALQATTLTHDDTSSIEQHIETLWSGLEQLLRRSK